MTRRPEPGDVVTIHKSGDEHDRESGRMDRPDTDGLGADYAWVSFGRAGLKRYHLCHIAAFGLRVGDKPWAVWDVVELLDNYPEHGIVAGQLATVLEVSATGRILHLQARGDHGVVRGPVLATRVHRLPK